MSTSSPEPLSVDLSILTAKQQEKVAVELAVRYRLEGAPVPGQTLADMIRNGLVVGTGERMARGRTVRGVLLDWPGIDEPQLMACSAALYKALT